MIRYKLFLLFILAPLLSGCSLSVDTELAEQAVEEFHENYNKDSFRAIYINASPAFQDFVSEDKFTRLLQKLHNKLGQHQSSDLIKWSAKTSIREGATITLTYKTVYEYDNQAKETFTFKVNDGLARLYNFNVSSEIMNQTKSSKETDV